MSIFKSIITAFRGRATQVGEAIIDAEAETILSQQVRDVESELRQSKIKIAELDGKRKGIEREVQLLQKKKSDAKSLAKQALDSKDEAKAIAILDAIDTEITPKLAPKEQQLKVMVDSLVKLRAALVIGEKKKIEFESRVEIAKTQRQVNRMTEEANASTLTSSTASSQIQATLDRFEKKNEHKANTLDSLEEMESNQGSLDKLLADNDNSGKSAADRLADM